MNETLTLALAWWRACCSARFSSAASGGRFARALSSTQPALWFLGSLLLRTSVALAGFYFVVRRALGAAAGVPARVCRWRVSS